MRPGVFVFGSLGFTEIAFILILALLIFGPKRLPEIGKTIGKGLAEFRRASNDLRRTLETEVAEEERAARPSPPPAARRPVGFPAPAAPGDLPPAPLEPGGSLDGSAPGLAEPADRID